MRALAVCLLLGVALPASAQVACPPATATVLDAYKGVPQPDRPLPSAQSRRQSLALADTITVRVSQLPTLHTEAECRKAGETVALFLNDRPMPGVGASPPTDPTSEFISFPLVRDGTTQAFWVDILGAPDRQFRPVKVSVGLTGRFAVPSAVFVPFEVVPGGPFVFWLALFGGAVGLFWYLAQTQDLLRDPAAQPSPGARRVFSMGRVQAAWWFFVVLVSYLFVAVVTGDFLSSMSSGALSLLGLSAVTAAGSASIDVSKNTPETQVLGLSIADRAGFDRDEIAAATPEDLRRKRALDATAKRARGESEGFTLDIVSDANGVSFHRFQLLIWGLALGVIFWWMTWKGLALPPLDTGLLGTYFVSAATFLGLKLPEPVVPTG